ncbi:MAG: hypothetical protein Q9214_001438 [Letrouitia sp. 1 TL-2023]
MSQSVHQARLGRDLLTQELSQNPYNPYLYLQRAYQYEILGYPDLAAGDGYRALLLADEILDESGEYYEQTLNAVQKCIEAYRKSSVHGDSSFEELYGAMDVENLLHMTADDEDDDPMSNCQKLANALQPASCVVLARTLLACGDLNAAYAFSIQGLKDSPGHAQLIALQQQIPSTYWKKESEKHPGQEIGDKEQLDRLSYLPENCYVRRELYPWNEHEPDRFSDSSLAFLNERMRSIAPKCEVRTLLLPVLRGKADSQLLNPPATVKQLGVFATEDIAPHELVLEEYSILTASNRLHDSVCDACSSPLPISSNTEPLLKCEQCGDTVFCSQACYRAAVALYHPAVCEKSDYDIVAKDPSLRTASNSLYLLLLGRAYAMAQTQNVHPLELLETKYLPGDFTTHESKKLPFSFNSNILVPFHLLEKMDIDIFSSLATTDTWIIQTLLAKFRAVASARMDPETRRPDVAAVHPMWCLANHSCAPNVKWELAGANTYVARGDDDVVIWGEFEGKEKGGIKGGEEVLSHYCDITQGVKERRGWAMGSLGGICMCERCLWEEAQERDEVEQDNE